MASITFDRLKYVEALKASGVPEGQARAHADALAQALADTPDVASKSDIAELKLLIAETKSDILKCMFGSVVGETAVIVARLKLLP
jgi:hypothetical protein